MGVTAPGPVKANRGVRAHVRAAGKVLEGDDHVLLSPLYYDNRSTKRPTARISMT